jgi:hypothetical protein
MLVKQMFDMPLEFKKYAMHVKLVSQGINPREPSEVIDKTDVIS